MSNPSYFLQHAERIGKEIKEETMTKVNGVEITEDQLRGWL